MRKILLIAMMIILSGCATWSTSSVNKVNDSNMVDTSTLEQNNIQVIIITEMDITDKKYRILGDIEVVVNKTTIFHSDPTRKQVEEKLKEEAMKLRADAVIFVRYGNAGISALSWGSLNGKGRAIVFLDE